MSLFELYQRLNSGLDSDAGFVAIEEDLGFPLPQFVGEIGMDWTHSVHKVTDHYKVTDHLTFESWSKHYDCWTDADREFLLPYIALQLAEGGNE